MRRTKFWAVILLAAWVTYNVCTRETGPQIHPEILLPFLAGHDTISAGVALLLRPGGYVLWYVGLSLTTRLQLIVAALLSWWAYLIAVRIIRRVLFLQS